jgi:hypothetical protein
MYIVIYFLVDYYHCIYCRNVNIVIFCVVVVSETPASLHRENTKTSTLVAKKRGFPL